MLIVRILREDACELLHLVPKMILGFPFFANYFSKSLRFSFIPVKPVNMSHDKCVPLLLLKAIYRGSFKRFFGFLTLVQPTIEPVTNLHSTFKLNLLFYSLPSSLLTTSVYWRCKSRFSSYYFLYCITTFKRVWKCRHKYLVDQFIAWCGFYRIVCQSLFYYWLAVWIKSWFQESDM